jgi:hypothetical protein
VTTMCPLARMRSCSGTKLLLLPLLATFIRAVRPSY